MSDPELEALRQQRLAQLQSQYKVITLLRNAACSLITYECSCLISNFVEFNTNEIYNAAATVDIIQNTSIAQQKLHIVSRLSAHIVYLDELRL